MSVSTHKADVRLDRFWHFVEESRFKYKQNILLHFKVDVGNAVYEYDEFYKDKTSNFQVILTLIFVVFRLPELDDRLDFQ